MTQVATPPIPRWLQGPETYQGVLYEVERVETHRGYLGYCFQLDDNAGDLVKVMSFLRHATLARNQIAAIYETVFPDEIEAFRLLLEHEDFEPRPWSLERGGFRPRDPNPFVLDRLREMIGTTFIIDARVQPTKASLQRPDAPERVYTIFTWMRGHAAGR